MPARATRISTSPSAGLGRRACRRAGAPRDRRTPHLDRAHRRRRLSLGGCSPPPGSLRGHERGCRRIDRLRRRQDPVRRARAHARRLRRALLAGRALLHRRARRRAGRRRLRRRRVRRAARPRRQHRRHRARRGRADVLLARRTTSTTSTPPTPTTRSSTSSASSRPSCRTRSRDADVLFLANIQPDLQREVREQCADARFVALDSMNLWIETARDSLVQTISGVDCVMLNDAELRHAHRASPNLLRAAREVDGDGARGWSSPSRASTARRCSPRTSSSPCRPIRSRPSSTRPAPATRFAGGFVGYLAAHADEEIDHDLLRRAMAYGTTLASFNVEEFGTERVRRLTARRDRRARRGAPAHHALRRRADPAARVARSARRGRDEGRLVRRCLSRRRATRSGPMA